MIIAKTNALKSSIARSVVINDWAIAGAGGQEPGWRGPAGQQARQVRGGVEDQGQELRGGGHPGKALILKI